MQKKLIALAIAGLSGAAFAQTNVTLSGLVDVGYMSQSIQTAGTRLACNAARSAGSAGSKGQSELLPVACYCGSILAIANAP